MKIVLENVGKRYGFEWIFKNLSFQFTSPQKYAVTGPNGSGKSTLLKIICGQSSPSIGKVYFYRDDTPIEHQKVFQLFTIAAPYIDLMELFTLKEALSFHEKFIPFIHNMGIRDLIDILGMGQSADKSIQYFSSGMKQRVKLILALCSNRPIAILDEPSTNLDEEGIQWTENLIEEYGKDKLLIIASNVENDLKVCNEHISLQNFKNKK